MAAVHHFGKGKCIWPFHTLWHPMIYIHTKFGEEILISGRGMSPQWNLTTPLQWNSTSSYNVYVSCPYGTVVCVTMQNFSEITQLAAKLWQFK